MTVATRTRAEDPLGEIQTKALGKILMAKQDRNCIIAALSLATAEAHQLGVQDAKAAQAVPPKRHRNWGRDAITDQVDDLRRRADNGEIGPYDDLQYLAGYAQETADNLCRRGERYYEKSTIA